MRDHSLYVGPWCPLNADIKLLLQFTFSTIPQNVCSNIKIIKKILCIEITNGIKSIWANFCKIYISGTLLLRPRQL